MNWCSVHYVNRTSFAFAGMTPAMAKAMRPSQMLYEPVNTFGIDRRHTIKFCLSAKQRPYPTITIRGQLSDNMVYTEKHIRIISVTTAAAIHPVIGSSENDVQLRTRHPETTAD
ncbi:transposase [Escherichia coli]|nr:transposase [Escherichia coli]EFF5754588.1 transposase [Escherichia coli]EGL8663568.1 hypothetical protein [Escherichia coli]EGO4240668.1 transposase [Escherichia coli]MBI0654151.1 hypothetical protein [Escherichia coli]